MCNVGGVCVCHLQKEYRRDLEREIVGKGMELSADVLEIQRATRASEIQSQVTVCVCVCAVYHYKSCKFQSVALIFNQIIFFASCFLCERQLV